jgi:putative Holliday junction resolvase
MDKMTSSANIRTLLCFDYGQRWIGVAFGQTITQTARPVTTLTAKSGMPDWQQLEKLITDWQPDALLVGIAFNSDGSISETGLQARQFIKQLQQRCSLPCLEVDEHLSSRAAAGQLLADNPKFDTKDKRLDSYAAKLIAETWLTKHA